jgi:dTDP-4-dehydrorhamnose reductase
MLKVVRLTKMIGCFTKPIDEWIARINKGLSISAFTDLHCAPITWDFAAVSILKTAASDRQGTYHVTGANDLSYFSIARRLFDWLPTEQIIPVESSQVGYNLIFSQKNTGLAFSSPFCYSQASVDFFAQLRAEIQCDYFN